MAAPDPVRGGFILLRNQAGRLGVVDEEHIAGEVHLRDVAFGGLAVNLDILVRKTLGVAVQGVVHFLRDRVEVVVAFDHIPARVHPQLFEIRNHTRQYFGDPAAHRRGVHMAYHFAFELTAEKTQLIHHLFADNGNVLIKQ